MDVNDFIEKILEYEDEYEIIITTNNGHYFICYDDINYKCSDLGNITYNELDALAYDLFNKISNETITEISNE